MSSGKRGFVMVALLIIVTATVVLYIVAQFYLPLVAEPQPSPTVEQQSATAVAQLPEPTATELPEPTATEQPAQTPTETSMPMETPSPEKELASPATSSPPQMAGIAPYPDAPLCPDSGEAHDTSRFHTLWDSERGCHYDHEHGQYPFTEEVVATFPDFDLPTLLGSVEIGHTNPSSEMENTHKHGGFKWDVTLSHSAGCDGREVVPTGVDALVVQYHAFGDYSVEFESRIHSAAGLMRQCQENNPGDYGYIFANQHQDYGQRVAPYQGDILPYPDTPQAAYDPAREPYFSVDCYGDISPCDKYPTLAFIVDNNVSSDSTWISEPVNLNGSGSPLFNLLFRVRDTYQALNSVDQSYPFTFSWICSSDGGASYDGSAGCRYNNTTTRIHEVSGEIPEEWDNLQGFDTDPRVGRVTAEGYVTRFGDLDQSCNAPGPDCHPIKLVRAFTGRYGSSFTLIIGAGTFTPDNLPERDIYFCSGDVCSEGATGAAASGWVGQNN